MMAPLSFHNSRFDQCIHLVRPSLSRCLRKEIPLHEKTRGNIIFQNARSGAGEQSAPVLCRRPPAPLPAACSDSSWRRSRHFLGEGCTALCHDILILLRDWLRYVISCHVMSWIQAGRQAGRQAGGRAGRSCTPTLRPNNNNKMNNNNNNEYYYCYYQYYY